MVSKLFSAAGNADLKLEVDHRVSRDIWAVTYITLAILTYLSLGGSMGPFGAWWAGSFRQLFGIGINIVPAILAIVGVIMLSSQSIRFNFTKVVGISLLVASFLGIVHISAPDTEMLQQADKFGGLVGFVASIFFRAALGPLGSEIILVALFLVAILLTFGVSFREVITFVRGLIFEEEGGQEQELKINTPENIALEKDEKRRVAKELQAATGIKEEEKKEELGQKKALDRFRINRPSAIKLAEEFKPQKSRVSDADWVPPSLDLLDEAAEASTMDEAELRGKAEVIRQKLGSFGLGVTMYDVNVGPSVMQYTLKPDEGIKLAKIKNLRNDLALALSAKSLRIEAPIPGKNLVGIEMPNDKRVPVRMKELLKSKAFHGINSNLRLVLGRDVAGHPMVADLAKMPHLLVAGQTGSGKSVAINAFMLSLIYQNSPNTLRMILVDPKRVELLPYNGIPHLLTPVINDPEKTVSALKWAVSEMTRRYIECGKLKVRNIAEYNEKAEESEKLPFIVIVIDELADLMMVSGKEVEACIVRLAQMARAVGIHLIVATQRPSVDVITGLIKANMPTRLAFRVASGVDSKTILDGVGAEDLLGQGDMLFIPPGQSDPVRIQGALVETHEVTKVTNAIKLDLGEEEPNYNENILDKAQADSVVIPGLKSDGGETTGSEDDSDDTTLVKALRVILETKRASASLLQRRLSLGYARAARVIDLMEERGFVGPAEGAKPRAIYITPDKLAELENGTLLSAEDKQQVAIRRQLDEMEMDRG